MRAIILTLGAMIIHLIWLGLIDDKRGLSAKPTRYGNGDVAPCTNVDLDSDPSHARPLCDLPHPFGCPPLLPSIVGYLLLLIPWSRPLPMLDLLAPPPQKCAITLLFMGLELYPFMER